jgi:hypothetical protein
MKNDLVTFFVAMVTPCYMGLDDTECRWGDGQSPNQRGIKRLRFFRWDSHVPAPYGLWASYEELKALEADFTTSEIQESTKTPSVSVSTRESE